jgi:hypothetical protein
MNRDLARETAERLFTKNGLDGDKGLLSNRNNGEQYWKTTMRYEVSSENVFLE